MYSTSNTSHTLQISLFSDDLLRSLIVINEVIVTDFDGFVIAIFWHY